MKSKEPIWHGLLYSTGILLLVCGSPGFVCFVLVMWLAGSLMWVHFGLLMLTIMVPLGGGLWFIAIVLSKWRDDSLE